MSMTEKTAAVTAALEKLGYRRIRELQITCPTQSRANVYLNLPMREGYAILVTMLTQILSFCNQMQSGTGE